MQKKKNQKINKKNNNNKLNKKKKVDKFGFVASLT